MSHQDDLDIEYKAASHEQPSELTDQLILKAAAEALEAKQQPQSNVIKGSFTSRRWHTPVSIAAAALITVSIVSSLKPWSVTVPEYSPESVVPAAQETDKRLVEAEDIIREEKSAIKADEKRAQDKQLTSKDIAETSMQMAPAIKPLKRNIQSPKVSTFADNESLDNAEQIGQIRLKETSPTIVQWFEVIDKNIVENETILAEINIKILLKQHPLSSFSEQQLIRLNKIRELLKLPELKQ